MSPAIQNQPRYKRRILPLALLAMLIASGAGAATGLVLEDSLTGTQSNSSLSVAQALQVTQVTPSGGDAGFATIHDQGAGFASHFECNNGDRLQLAVTIANQGGFGDLAFSITVADNPSYITFGMEGDDRAYNDTDGDGTYEAVVMTGLNTWISSVGAGSTNTILITIALEDASPTGFVDLTYLIEPVNY